MLVARRRNFQGVAMKLKVLVATGLLASSSAILAASASPAIAVGKYPRLNVVHYQTSVEQWVTTKTALVTVGVDANLNQNGTDTLQQQINSSLQSLASDASWQMTDYERNQDASGLERIHIEEQARLTADQLNNLRSKTDTLSKPGIKYSIIDMQFTPSLAEMQAAQDALRAQLYDKIKQETNLLNKTYDQDFYVHNIQFFNGDAPMPMPQNGVQFKAMAMAAAPSQGGTTMSQRLVMSADVVLAATIKP